MGKTDTIRDRRIDVYADSLDRKARWTELADEADQSLSKFVQHCVEYAIERGGPDYAELGQESQQIQELEQELRELRKEIKQKDIVIETLESETRKMRVKPFLDDDFEGTRSYDQELIEVLQESDRVTGGDILNRLGIEPMETELVQGVNRQLEQLEEYGLVQSTAQGWVWVG